MDEFKGERGVGPRQCDMREKKTLDMCEGPLLGSVLRFSLPLMATGVLSQLYNSMDSVVVGRCAGG